MRKASIAYGLIVDDEKFIGIALGYDYCAEHEWGIDGLEMTCGIPTASKDKMGIANRTVTKCPPLVFKETISKKMKFALLYTGRVYNTQEENEKYVPQDFTNYIKDLMWNEKWNKEHPDRDSKDNIITAWDGDSFGVAVMGETEVGYLKELYKACQDLNLTIAISDLRAKNPFAGSSLCLLITDRIPQEAIDAMYHADKQYFDRVDYEEKIGMKKLIAKYGNKNGYKGDKYFLACSPKWIDYDDPENREKRKKEMKTKYDIQYWINYSDDDENHGWYTVEQIKKWLTTKGLRLIELKGK